MEITVYRAVVVAKRILLSELELAREENDKELIDELLDELNVLNEYLLRNAK